MDNSEKVRTIRLVRSGEGRSEPQPAGLPAPGLGAVDLERALAEDRVKILLQPQVDLATGKMTGVEALARLVGEDGGLISPAEFVPLAERTGLIRPLGRRIFALACQAAVRLAEEGRPEVRVAINLSAIQLADSVEVGALVNILLDSGVSPSQIEVELTETAAIESFAVVQEQIQRFRALGVSVAIDDFGTGFSSFAYLLELEVDRIKIDRRFVADLGRGSCSSLTGALIELGHKLSLDVVAEGVETEAQASWLRRHHCPTAQGYLFSRPLSLEQLLALPIARPRPEARPQWAWRQLAAGLALMTQLVHLLHRPVTTIFS